jgi:hypothetical protein
MLDNVHSIIRIIETYLKNTNYLTLMAELPLINLFLLIY